MCKRADPVPQLSKYLVDRAMGLKPYHLDKGIPEMKLSSINSIRISKLDLHLPVSGFTANISDIRAKGGKDFQIGELNFDLVNKKVLLLLTIPKLYIEMLYRVNGKLLLFDFNSNGKGYLNISNIESNTFADMVFETRNGKEYLKIQEDKSLSYIKYEHAETYFENLFKDDKELTDQTNKFLNDNAKVLQPQINPLVCKPVRAFLLGIINTVYSEYSLDELFD